MSVPFLSVVIPAYNEAQRLGKALAAVSSYLGARGITSELIVVDDGSSDGTADLVEATRRGDPRLRLVRFPVNRGKGAAVREGVLAATGSLVLITDADLSTPIEEFDRLLARMRESASDVVIGSRNLPASRIEVHQPFWREWMGRVFNRLTRALTGLSFRDTQCGFKLLAREKAAPIFRKAVVDRFAFDVEILWLAQLAGLRILEEPVTWRNSPSSRVSSLRDSWSMFRDVVKLRRRIRRGFYREREKTLASER